MNIEMTPGDRLGVVVEGDSTLSLIYDKDTAEFRVEALIPDDEGRGGTVYRTGGVPPKQCLCGEEHDWTVVPPLLLAGDRVTSAPDDLSALMKALRIVHELPDGLEEEAMALEPGGLRGAARALLGEAALDLLDAGSGEDGGGPRKLTLRQALASAVCRLAP